MKKISLILLLSVFICNGFSSAWAGEADEWRNRLVAAVQRECEQDTLLETSIVGMALYDLTDDTLFYTQNYRQRIRPASNQKIVTAVSALYFLGPEYNFTTSLCIDGEVSNGSLHGDVYVIGGMDPMLDSTDVREMALALKKEGIDSICGHLYLDLSMKDDNPMGWGWCWDDFYGPLTPLFYQREDQFPQAWVGALKHEGIWMDDYLTDHAIAPERARQITLRSHTFDQVLVPMMKRSDNMYAESMFYNLASLCGQKGVGRLQAAEYINRLITKLGLSPWKYQIADGSGVSLYNYLSPELLLQYIIFAWKDETLRQHLYPALPIGGVDGTLKSRMKGTSAENNVHAKTGTVNGVSTLTGYATATNGHVLAFSIMNQGIRLSSLGRDFQDKICAILTSQK